MGKIPRTGRADPPHMWGADTRHGWLLAACQHERELPGCLINVQKKALLWLRARSWVWHEGEHHPG